MSWRLGISSGSCADCPILDILPALRVSGATGIEIGTPPGHFDPWEPDEVTALERAVRESGLQPVSIHAPFGGKLDLADPNPQHRHAAVGAILTAAAALHQIGGRLVVVHPSDLERHHHDAGARLTQAAASLNLLHDNLARSGMHLTVESPLPHLVAGHPDEFAWLLGRLHDDVRVCLDTGHTALGHAWRRFVDVSRGRIGHVHAHDNHGHRDDHLPPGDGRIDWDEVVRSLSDARFEGWVMLELAKTPGDLGAYFHGAFERATRIFSGARLAPGVDGQT
ncbi:MAG TPA: sugar phosphate isomerase/epimerase family protein [Vicinamibacterales bacterium]|nr:sugar phosphate isomerase/epimerase family protein [Vicinamibacterales bacterium]